MSSLEVQCVKVNSISMKWYTLFCRVSDRLDHSNMTSMKFHRSDKGLSTTEMRLHRSIEISSKWWNSIEVIDRPFFCCVLDRLGHSKIKLLQCQTCGGLFCSFKLWAFPNAKGVARGENATHCNTLQHTTTHCNTLQHAATHLKLQVVSMRNCKESRFVAL